MDFEFRYKYRYWLRVKFRGFGLERGKVFVAAESNERWREATGSMVMVTLNGRGWLGGSRQLGP